ESFFNVATQIEEMDRLPAPSRKIIESYGGRSLHEQSHGESFFSLMVNRFGGNGLYILDEPEAALSPARQIAMLHLIRDLVEKGSQFLISTHSPILTAFPGATIYEFRETGLIKVRWEETENYILTKRFLTNPAYFLDED
ncbi:MAG: AAA family ATPase, partial [Firmicutes bacterium]|nr:AAA family ATPase [Bacillota bacterium]